MRYRVRSVNGLARSARICQLRRDGLLNMGYSPGNIFAGGFAQQNRKYVCCYSAQVLQINRDIPVSSNSSVERCL